MAAAKRKKSARKSATPRKRNAAPKRRKRAAAKSPVRRKRRAVARKSNPRRSPVRRRRRAAGAKPAAAPRKRRKAARKGNPGRPVRRRKSRRRSNPGFSAKGFLASLVAGVKEGAKAAVVVLPALALKNAIGSVKVKAKDAAGVEFETTFAEKIGPLYDLGAATVLLAVIPPVLGKVGLGKFAEQGKWGLRILWLLTAAKTAAYVARHGWSLDPAKAIPPGTEAFPAWTDLLDVGSKSLQGQASYSGGRFVGGRQLAGALPPGSGMGMFPSTSANNAIWGNQGYRTAA